MPEWRIAGSYVSGCACQMICACPVGGHPTGPDGQCFGCAVFNITNGNFGEVDLSGVKYAFYNRFPKIAREGNWTIGVIVDESASGEQASAIDEIMQGKHGGPFGEWVAMVADYKPMERAKIDYSDTKISVTGHTDLAFEPFMGADGAPTTVKNAPGGAAHEFKIGQSTGSSTAFGIHFDFNYGEAAEFEYASEMGREEIHIRTR